MADRWSADQVRALAPDAASVRAGDKLATPTPWRATGATPVVLWGHCAGSGTKPYQTIVDLRGPAYKCSCPSRKFPCKHALGLLLLWSQGEVPDSDAPPEDAAAWLAGRTARAEQTSDTPAAPKDPERAAKTAAARVDRVRGGIDELQLWLTDQVGLGLAGSEVDSYRTFDAVAARLVDAQAPGLAARVRRLPALISGYSGDAVDWPEHLLEEYGRIWSLCTAHQRIDTLPDGLARTVRRHVGYPVAKADVLAAPGVSDAWLVLGRREIEEDHLQSRRTWVWGFSTRRFGMILDYAPTGGILPNRPVVDYSLTTAMHFYPGTPELRCVYDDATQSDTPPPPTADLVNTLPAGDIADARRRRAGVIADDPWALTCPVVISGRLGRTADNTPTIIDDAGAALPLPDIADRWALLLAATGGASVRLFGELGMHGLDAISVITDERVISL
ncbi:SWIM zinc finger family protein [Gordonia sp. CPCC 205515]|uniref:SWIM zinc finger family protein n=1 Tax=Gordonia sp. CPCC 205515 TaxID=3140791 RepID=UPI003AF38199